MDFHKHLLFVNWKLTYKEQLFLRDRLLQSLMTEHHTHTHAQNIFQKALPFIYGFMGDLLPLLPIEFNIPK